MTASARVALVVMPWGAADSPSLQCGLLKAVLEEQGHEVDIHYANVLLADRIGPRRYDALLRYGGARNRLLGEWIFTAAAFGADALPAPAYLAEFSDALDGLQQETPETIAELHEQVLPAFIKELAEQEWGSYDLIGFSSTFAQNVACLALARAIKERHPQIPIVFGGANVDAGMGEEYLRVFPYLDYVVRGEGERVLSALVTAIAAGQLPEPTAGLVLRAGGAIVSGGQAPMLPSLQGLPVPDYREYFDLLDELGSHRITRGRRPRVQFESSRGCWWGAKHHCTFCGLNALGMTYRRKPVEQVAAEIEELSRRHHALAFAAVDNIIDHASMAELCDRLAEGGYDYSIFYEVKANLTREQVRRMAAAGVSSIQPGIESLSTHVLELMRKGTSKLLNIRVMKWGLYYGMNVNWSILAGFPGETDADYDEQAELLPLLHHLRPPAFCGRIWLERFSPYFNEPGHGFREVQPLKAYDFAYPVDGIDRGEIAYYFDYEVDGTVGDAALGRLQQEVEAWRRVWNGGPPILRYFTGPGWVRVMDTRWGKTQRYTLDGDEAEVFLAISDSQRSLAGLARDLPIDADRIAAILEELVAARLVVAEAGHFLGLAIPVVRAGSAGPR